MGLFSSLGSIFDTVKDTVTSGFGAAGDFFQDVGGAIFGGNVRTPGIVPSSRGGSPPISFPDFGSTLPSLPPGTFEDVRQSGAPGGGGFLDRVGDFFDLDLGNVTQSGVGAAALSGLGAIAGSVIERKLEGLFTRDEPRVGGGGIELPAGSSGPSTAGVEAQQFTYGDFVEAITPGVQGTAGLGLEGVIRQAFDIPIGDQGDLSAQERLQGIDALPSSIQAPGAVLTRGHTHGGDLQQLAKSKTRQRQVGTWTQGRDFILGGGQPVKENPIWQKNKGRWRSAGKQFKMHLRAIWDSDPRNEAVWEFFKKAVKPRKKKSPRRKTVRRTTRSPSRRKSPVSHRRPTTHKHAHRSPSKGHAHKGGHVKRRTHKHRHTKAPSAAQKRVRAAFARKNRGRKGKARGGRL